jgi:predicted permease
VLTVAGAVTITAWTMTWGLWLKPLPFPEPDRLVSPGWTQTDSPRRMAATSVDEFLDIKTRASAVMDIASLELQPAWYVDRGDRREDLSVAFATTSLFDVIGVQAALGRTFRPDDADSHATMPHAVISHRLWQRLYASDPGVTGRALDVIGSRERRTLEIVGVLPSGIRMPNQTVGDANAIDVYVAVPDGRRTGGSQSRRIYDRSLVARLKPAVTVPEVEARLTDILRQIDNEQGFKRTRHAKVLPLAEHWFGRATATVWLLASAAGLVVLIAVANLTGLLSVIASRRRKELAIRTALGATRRSLRLQALAEVTGLATLAWVLATGLAVVLTAVFVAVAPQDLPRLSELRVDWQGAVLGSIVTAVCAIVPAAVAGWSIASRVSHQLSLANAANTGASPEATLLRGSVIAMQSALVLALIGAAGLVGTTLWRLLDQPLGFDPQGITVARVTLTERLALDQVRYQHVMDDIRRDLLAFSGQRAVALAFDPPLASFNSNMRVEFLHRSPAFVPTKFVTDGYFAAMGTPLLAGRDFTRADFRGTPTALVNERFAREFYGSIEAAIGQRFDFGPRHEIIGVVADMREGALAADVTPILYPLLVAELRPLGQFHVVVRDLGASTTPARAIEEIVRKVDPGLYVVAHPLADRLRVQTATVRTQAYLLGILAIATSGLALLGLYATIVQIGEERRRELAIRAALGATERSLIRLVVRGALMAVLAGVAGGALLTMMVARLTRQFLFEMSPFDPAVWGGAAVLLIGAATFAAWLPARRSGRANPMLALKL